MAVGLGAVRYLTASDETDAELLGRFAARRDEAAFALLVRRHGAMVFGVCRRVLPTDQDAEDAFQATFLVLAQKARTAAPREVGNWLHGVARRAALLTRRSIARRRERTGDVPERPASEADQLRAMLDEELSRLPDIYRAVLVLCDLEGRTRREAAALLGWPEGTVAGRLVRARELLAKRLAPAVSVAALLAGPSSARVPAVLAPAAAVPAGVAALAREVLGVMARGKLMKTAVVILLACAGFGLALRAGPEKADAAQPPAPAAGTADKGPEPRGKPAAAEVVWGKEVGGLQLGLVRPPGARVVAVGSNLRLEVRVRNVGTAEAKIVHSLLREVAPAVTGAGDKRVWVAMPPSFRGYVPPTERVVRPGETISLFHPELAVEGRLIGKIGPEPAVGTPTVRVGPGSYEIAYARLLTSHPTLSTGSVEFEVKDAPAPAPDDVFVWGKEADGLQAGISFGDTKSYRIGDKVTPKVRVRNVGKTPVNYSYFAASFHFATPLVEDTVGRRVAVNDPPHFYSFPTSKDATLKAGESIDFGGAALGLAPPLKQDIHAVRVEPGRYTLGYSNFIKSHPTLATGTAEFEVKAAAPPLAATAWGKEVGGLQVGLAFESERATYRHGETAKVVLRVRNVSKEAIEFPHIWAFFVENPPTVTDPDGKTVPFPRGEAEGRQLPRTTTVAPGKAADLYEWEFDLRPTGQRGLVNGMIRGTGKFTLQCERVVGPTSGNPTHPNPAMDKLATGPLELVVTAENAPAAPAGARPGFTVHLAKSPPWPGRSRCAFLDGDRLLVHAGPGSGDVSVVHRGLQVRDAKDGTLLKCVTVKGQIVSDFRVSADRKWVAAVTTADTTGTFTIPSPGVTVWDAATWTVRGTVAGHNLLDIACDGRTVLVQEDDGWGAAGGRVEVWDAVARKQLRAAPFDFKRIDAGALSPDGSLVVVSGLNEVAYWKWRDGDAHDRLRVGRTVTALAFSPDGKLVAEGPGPRLNVEVRDTTTLKVAHTLSDPAQPRVSLDTAGLTFADAGKTLVLGNGIGLIESIPVPHRILFWDVRTGALTRQIDTKGGAPYSLAVSPDGKTLAALTADDGVSLRTWELTRGDGPVPR